MTASLAPQQPEGDAYSSRVAALLRGYLAEERIKNRDLARRLGQTDFWVGRRVNGQTPITVGELAMIAEALGQPISRFLPHPHQRGQDGGRAADTLNLGTRSSTDRASDYGSQVGARRPTFHPQRRRTDRRHLSVVPIYAVA